MSKKEFNVIKVIYLVSFILITITALVSALIVFTSLPIPVPVLLVLMGLCVIWLFVLIVYMTA